MGHRFLHLLGYVLAWFFTLLGFACLVLPLSEGMRQLLIQFLQHNYVTLFLFGLIFLMIGGAIMVNLSISSRRRHYVVRTGPYPVTVDTALIENTLRQYWNKQFPKREIPCRVTVKRETIQIAADLPNTPLEKQRPLLKQMEGDLQNLLADTLGYQKPLRLYISFGE